uniref:HORMA domain-containing protein n=1 Tax=Elaeophora elaphi TaxID=1147741 RepID=A0A0R3RTI4_9BILA
MEAIEFSYLRDFIIMVADRNRNDEYEALEVHRMSFFYESNQPEMIITREVLPYTSNTLSFETVVAAIKYIGIKQARKQFFHLIRRVNAFGNILGPLPEAISTIFKLTYYDERTPTNYEPQGFRADESLFHFPKESESLILGRFDCEKHMVTASVHSIFMKSATEMKSLMNADAAKFNLSVSRDTTTSCSPTKTLRTFSTCTDEFSQIQEDGTEQQNDLIRSAELMASSSYIDISGTLEIAKICRTFSSTCDKANCNGTS